MKIYKLKCNVLTPIHIGDGTEIYPYEYVIKDKFYKISLEDFILNLQPEKQNEVINLIEKDVIGLRQFLQKNFDPTKHKFEYSIEASQRIKMVYETKIHNELNQLLISPFIRTSNKPYIPGSSLKGAIRTAVVANFFQKQNSKFKSEPEILQYCDENKKIDLTRDPFRGIKITDAILAENSTIIEEITTITKTGEIKTNREVVYPEVQFCSELRLDDELYNLYEKMKLKFDIETISKSCNNFYKETLIKYENKYFHDRNKPEVKKIYEQIYSIRLDNNSFLLRIGWGSGKNSVSLNLKLQKPEYIKTRKLIERKYPLGWIKVKIEKEES